MIFSIVIVFSLVLFLLFVFFLFLFSSDSTKQLGPYATHLLKVKRDDVCGSSSVVRKPLFPLFFGSERLNTNLASVHPCSTVFQNKDGLSIRMTSNISSVAGDTGHFEETTEDDVLERQSDRADEREQSTSETLFNVHSTNLNKTKFPENRFEEEKVENMFIPKTSQILEPNVGSKAAEEHSENIVENGCQENIIEGVCNFAPLMEVQYVEPKIWLDGVTQNIYRINQVRKGTAYFICKHVSCKATCKVSSNTLTCLVPHSNHYVTNQELLMEHLVKSAMFYRTLLDKSLDAASIYEETLKLFPSFQNDKLHKKRMTGQIGHWKRKKQSIDKDLYEKIVSQLQVKLISVPNCKVCLTRPSIFITLPCSHLCLCEDCSVKFGKDKPDLYFTCCPSCSEILMETPKRIYFD